MADYRTEVNPARQFLLSHYSPAQQGRVEKAHLYKEYAQWCEVNGHRNPLCSIAFGKEVRRAFPDVKDGSRRRAAAPVSRARDAYLGLGSHPIEVFGDDGPGCVSGVSGDCRP